MAKAVNLTIIEQDGEGAIILQNAAEKNIIWNITLQFKSTPDIETLPNVQIISLNPQQSFIKKYQYDIPVGHIHESVAFWSGMLVDVLQTVEAELFDGILYLHPPWVEDLFVQLPQERMLVGWRCETDFEGGLMNRHPFRDTDYLVGKERVEMLFKFCQLMEVQHLICWVDIPDTQYVLGE